MSRPSKRGLSWPTSNTDPVFPFTKPGSRITWLYNWSPHPTPNATSLTFIPMQWNAVSIEQLPVHLATAASSTKTADPPTLLAFNEPERGDQAAMSAVDAARVWLEHVEPLRRGAVRCGSPGISSAPEGVSWLKEFVGEVRRGGGDVDFWALHWYGEGLGAFYDYIWSVHHQLGAEKPVWITEFACTNWNEAQPLSREAVEQFAKESWKYLDTLDWVEKYAWFGPMRSTGTVGTWARFLDDDGKLTALGKAYRDE